MNTDLSRDYLMKLLIELYESKLAEDAYRETYIAPYPSSKDKPIPEEVRKEWLIELGKLSHQQFQAWEKLRNVYNDHMKDILL